MTPTAELALVPPPVDPAPLAARSVRSIVIDSHATSRIGLVALLRDQPWTASCLAAPAREEAVALIGAHRPDVAILDVSETGPFAGAITAEMRAAHPGLQIILSSRCKTSIGVPATAIGAVSFLGADSSSDAILAAVRAALVGVEEIEGQPLPVLGIELSDREREILLLLGTGATNREIAARLHLGPDSIKKNATALYRKLGVRNRTEAVQRASSLLGGDRDPSQPTGSHR
ncbi:MAG TPA: response regulator transcription factor [Solirubrobacterales bacterium]|nr:response regulator transcription factor [Solirubrobacterales bacterium]